MALKKLLVAFTTTRAVKVGDKEENRRVRFAAGKVVDLTDDELDLLDRLTKSTGKLHYRSPINEGGGSMTASEPEIVDVPDYAGQDKPMDEKSVDHLKAYLDFHGIEYAGNASKAKLLEAAKAHEVGQTDDKSGGSTDSGAGDPDGGL